MSEETEGAVERKPYLWKYTAIIALLALVFALVLQIYDRFWGVNGPQFVVAAEYDDFTLPPKLAEAISLSRAVGEKLESEGPGAAAIEYANRKKTGPRLLIEPADEVYSSLQGLVTVSLRNEGNLPAKGVRLAVNNSGIALIEWDDDRREEMEFVQDIRLGTVEQGKAATVKIWTVDPLSPDASLLLAHDSGKQSLSLADPPTKEWTGLSAVLVLVLVVLFSSAAGGSLGWYLGGLVYRRYFHYQDRYSPTPAARTAEAAR